MKKTIFPFFAILLIATAVHAQMPEKMSYQAVVYNNSNQLVQNQAIEVKISILQGTASGTVVYEELCYPNPVTDVNGLISVLIGDGLAINGNYSTIDWTMGPYFIELGVNITGGTNFTTIATNQLLSVPFALHSKKAESVLSPLPENDTVFAASVANAITAADTAYWNQKPDTYMAGTGIDITNNVVSRKSNFYLGQDTLGGIVFHIYLDSLGVEHGLIVAKTETILLWRINAAPYGTLNLDDGFSNTALWTNSPAKDWITANFSSEWYLPSYNEVYLLYINRFHVNKACRNGGYTLLLHECNSPNTIITSESSYASSTENVDGSNMTICFGLYFMAQSIITDKAVRIRPIRSF